MDVQKCGEMRGKPRHMEYDIWTYRVYPGSPRPLTKGVRSRPLFAVNPPLFASLKPSSW